MYYDGDVATEVQTNEAECFRWLTLSAEQGHREAQFCLGMLHARETGLLGAPPNPHKAAQWWVKAAREGHIPAAKMLPEVLTYVFPRGTRVELVGLDAAFLNGKKGVIAPIVRCAFF
jgi:TPR repeat protein